MTPSELKAFLHEHGIRLKKSLSQNFLIDSNITRKIVREADIQPGEHILEIGPGAGSLTYSMLEAGAEVTAVEKDERLAHLLAHPNLTVHCKDILEFPLETLPPCKVVANLPYQITTPIITRLIAQPMRFTRILVMVQDEVARRYTAHVGTADYSSITLFLHAHADVKYGFKVSRKCFFPVPKVDSAIIELIPKPCPFPPEFFKMVRTAFGQRRKMLRSTLKHLPIKEALSKMDLPETTRPQELTLEQFASLYELTR